MADAKLGTWTVPESPVTIEYSPAVVEEIRRAVTDGYQRLSRGGIEVGGALYGVREGETVRIQATRPIACEHARGPAFLFSENDRTALTAQLRQDAADPHLAGMLCVGWYVSHTRTGILLSDSDIEIYNSFFPESHQVTLVVRPGRGMSMRAGFFVREFDGALRTESSYQEFSFPDRLSAVLDRPPRPPDALERRMPVRAIDLRTDPGPSPTPAMNPFAAVPELEVAQAQSPLFDAPSPRAGTPAKKKWIWLVLWALVLVGIAAAGVRYFLPLTQPEPIGLNLAEKDGVLQVQWNHLARPVAGASRGTLEINDGKQPRAIALSTTDLARGSFAYQRTSGDIEVRLTVESPLGSKTQEVSRYLGAAPPASRENTEDVQAMEQRREELQQEIQRLRAENEKQTARIQQLERTVRILQTRLGQK